MTMKTAGDLMIPLEEYPHIPYWFTIRQAVAEMEKSVIERNERQSLPRSLLVFDQKYDLLGLVRRRDILRALEPKFLRTMAIPHRRKFFDVEIDPDLLDLTPEKITKGIIEQTQKQVGDVMSPIVSTLDYKDTLYKIVYKMHSRDLDVFPVLKDEKVVGVVRSVDVFINQIPVESHCRIICLTISI